MREKSTKQGKGKGASSPLSPTPLPFPFFPISYAFRRLLRRLGNTAVSHRLSPPGTFRHGGRLRLSDRKFHTDDVNQCLCGNKSDNHRGPDVNLVDFMFPLVDYGKVLCSSANELQQNSNASFKEEYILRKL